MALTTVGKISEALESAREDVRIARELREFLDGKRGPQEKSNSANDAYAALANVLDRAFEQASGGKGKDRHVKADDQKFQDQPICSLQRIYGNGYALGQVGKKMEESMRMDKDAAVAELLGGIVYLAAAVIVREEEP